MNRKDGEMYGRTHKMKPERLGLREGVRGCSSEWASRCPTSAEAWVAARVTTPAGSGGRTKPMLCDMGSSRPCGPQASGPPCVYKHSTVNRMRTMLSGSIGQPRHLT